MTKRGVSQVVRQGNRLYQVFVGAQSTGNRLTDLGYLQGMCQTRAVVIPFVVNKYLRFILQPAESGRMEYAIPITLKCSPIPRLIFRIDATFCVLAPKP